MVSFISAHSDGATTLAAALAVLWSARERTLLIDLNLDRPDISTLLDVGEAKTMYHLAFNAQLSPVSAGDLEEHLSWREGLAVLPGIARDSQREAITEHFIAGLLDQALDLFDRVVVDLGRVRADLPRSTCEGSLVWVVCPGPYGLTAVERASAELRDASATWTRDTSVVLNRCGSKDFVGVDRFLPHEYGLNVTAQVADLPGYVRTVELSHSLRALSVPVQTERGFTRRYGPEALTMRRAIEGVASAVPQTASLEVAHGS